MELFLNIVSFGVEPLPAGSPITVEIRDTSLADAPAITLLQLRSTVPSSNTTMAVPVRLELTAVPNGTTVWAHVDTDRDGRVSPGDFVTVESYPVTSEPTQKLTIWVKKVL
jgi:hypothetical protein